MTIAALILAGGESKRFNHAANEVLIDGKWMFLDSTNGTVWRNDDDPFILFSFNTILNLENEKQFRYKNENDIWNMTNTFLVQRGVRNINQYNYIFDELSWSIKYIYMYEINSFFDTFCHGQNIILFVI